QPLVEHPLPPPPLFLKIFQKRSPSKIAIPITRPTPSPYCERMNKNERGMIINIVRFFLLRSGRRKSQNFLMLTLWKLMSENLVSLSGQIFLGGMDLNFSLYNLSVSV